MKILYISSSTIWGGATIALYNIIKELHVKHEIMVILPQPYGRLCDELDTLCVKYRMLDYGLTIYPRNKNPILWLRHFIGFLRRRHKSLQETSQIIGEFQPDIVHVNVGPLDISLDYCLKNNIPHIWHMREYQDLDFNSHFWPSKKSFLNKIHKNGNYNLAITDDIFKYWQLREGVDKIIYDGVVERELVSESDTSSKRDNSFLFVGRVEEAKGVYDMLLGFVSFLKRTNKGEYRLLIAGQYYENEYYYKCKELIDNNHIQDSVSFLGHRNDIYTLMKSSKALIVPSLSEGFGIITVEAMANGLLVIGRDTAGTKEQFDRGREIVGKEIALRFKNTEELVCRMEEIINDDFLEMRRNAQIVVSDNYTIEKNAENIMHFYQEVIKKHYAL